METKRNRIFLYVDADKLHEINEVISNTLSRPDSCSKCSYEFIHADIQLSPHYIFIELFSMKLVPKTSSNCQRVQRCCRYSRHPNVTSFGSWTGIKKILRTDGSTKETVKVVAFKELYLFKEYLKSKYSTQLLSLICGYM